MKNQEHTACLAELIHGLIGAHHLCSAFRGFIHLGNFEPGYDTTCKDAGHHISPQWYDIVHFGPKPLWICFFGLYPKRPHTNGDIYPSLYAHDPPHF